MLDPPTRGPNGCSWGGKNGPTSARPPQPTLRTHPTVFGGKRKECRPGPASLGTGCEGLLPFGAWGDAPHLMRPLEKKVAVGRLSLSSASQACSCAAGMGRLCEHPVRGLTSPLALPRPHIGRAGAQSGSASPPPPIQLLTAHPLREGLRFLGGLQDPHSSCPSRPLAGKVQRETRRGGQKSLV